MVPLSLTLLVFPAYAWEPQLESSRFLAGFAYHPKTAMRGIGTKVPPPCHVVVLAWSG